MVIRPHRPRRPDPVALSTPVPPPKPPLDPPQPGTPYCEPCKSWHPRATSYEHWRELHCHAPCPFPKPPKVRPVYHRPPRVAFKIAQWMDQVEGFFVVPEDADAAAALLAATKQFKDFVRMMPGVRVFENQEPSERLSLHGLHSLGDAAGALGRKEQSNG